MGNGQSTSFLSRAEHKGTLSIEPPYGHLPMSPTVGAKRSSRVGSRKTEGTGEWEKRWKMLLP